MKMHLQLRFKSETSTTNCKPKSNDYTDQMDKYLRNTMYHVCHQQKERFETIIPNMKVTASIETYRLKY